MKGGDALCGLMAGGLYNRFYDLTLPSYLSFFGGRRFVPIVSGLGGLGLALAFGSTPCTRCSPVSPSSS